MKRQWDSLHPDTLYGDAAARVLCRILDVEPSGRTLQQILDQVPIEPNKEYALQNAIEGDGRWLECKASTKDTANVCITELELYHSDTVAVAAWVPGTDELFWVASKDEVQKAARWLEFDETYLVCRDMLKVL